MDRMINDVLTGTDRRKAEFVASFALVAVPLFVIELGYRHGSHAAIKFILLCLAAGFLRSAAHPRSKHKQRYAILGSVFAGLALFWFIKFSRF